MASLHSSVQIIVIDKAKGSEGSKKIGSHEFAKIENVRDVIEKI